MLSHQYNPGTWTQETIQHLFHCAVRDHRDKNLIISGFDGSIFTFGDAADVVQRIMAKLNAEGIRKGDAVCVYAPVHVESFLLFWAAACLGVIFVPVDHNVSEKALERVMNQVKPKAFFCDVKNYLGVPSIKERVRTIVFDAPEDNRVHGARFFSEWLGSSPDDMQLPEVSPNDPVVMMFTSGSTGEPKGIVISNRALYQFGKVVNELFGLTSNDIVLSHGDMHSTGGLRSATAALHAGYSFLVLPLAQRSSIFSVVEYIRKYRCTQFSTTPMTIRHLVQYRDRIRASDLGSLRSIVSAGSFLSQQLIDAVYQQYHVPVLNCYGLTETMGIIIGNSRESFTQAQGSVGLTVGDAVVEIVDEEGRVLPDGTAGELRVRCKMLMTEYFQNPGLTARVMRSGWFHTGDLATKRPDGHVVLTGRIKNIIKQANGDLVSLEEVEQSLEKHPGVREASVCGYTSSRGDERLAAFVVADAPPMHVEEFFKDLRRHLKDELGTAKVPAEFFLKDALPRGGTGKVLREKLKQEVEDL